MESKQAFSRQSTFGFSGRPSAFRVEIQKDTFGTIDDFGALSVESNHHLANTTVASLEECTEDSFLALSEHPFFASLRKEVTVTMARACRYRVFHTPGEVLISEEDNNRDEKELWAVHKGSVTVEESGEELGFLQAGSVFGDSVAFGRTECQPFTISVREVPLVVWCIPASVVVMAIRRYPQAMVQLQEIVDLQVRKLLMKRIMRMIFFQNCSPNFVKQLSKRFKVRYYSRKTTLWWVDDTIDSMIILCRGTVQLNTKEVVKKERRAVTVRARASVEEEVWDPERTERGPIFFDESEMADIIGAKQAEEEIEQQHRLSKKQSRLRSTLGEVLPALKIPESTSLSARRGWDSVRRLSASGGFLQVEQASLQVEDGDDPTRKARFAAQVDDEEAEEEEVEEDEEEESDETESEEQAEEQEEEESEEDDSDDELSEGNSQIEDEGPFLTENLACTEPKTGSQIAIAGKHLMVFGECALFGQKEEQQCKATAVSDCIAIMITAEDFEAAVERHPREKKRFELLKAIGFREWKRCGLDRLPTLDMFSKLKRQLLLDLAQEAQPQIFYPGSEIMTSGQELNGLLILMEGRADVLLSDGKKQKVSSPHVFGVLQWLDEERAGKPDRVKAREVCQVLQLTRETLLSTLAKHPDQTMKLISQALRLVHKRVSITHGIVDDDSAAGMRRAVNKNLWYLPFCKELSPEFTIALTNWMESFKLVPGQKVFRTLKGDMADFLVVLTLGSAVVKAADGTSHEVNFPLVIAGFDKSRPVDLEVTSISEVYRLPLSATTLLSTDFPEDTRVFFTRLANYQERLEVKRGYLWWHGTSAFKHHQPFSECSDDFMKGVAPLIRQRFYVPGEAITVHEDRFKEVVLLETGKANVEWNQTRTGVVEYGGAVKDGYLVGGIGGIYGFAGMRKRTATLRATTLCKVLEVPIDALLNLLNFCAPARQKFREVAEKLFKGIVPERLEDHPFFKSFNPSFLNTIRTKCEPQVFFDGESIVRQCEDADSMIVIGAETVLTLWVDGRKVKELRGGATLGVRAILSPNPVQRTATIIANSACTVRRLTRSDWVDALKLCPDHRRWIRSFIQQQYQLADEEAQSLNKRRNVGKVKERRTAAMKHHLERCRAGVESPKEKDNAQRRQVTSPALAMTLKTPRSPSENVACVEEWECFNGLKVLVPHTRLPQLGPVPTKPVERIVSEEVAKDSHEESSRKSSTASVMSTVNRRRSSLASWHECDLAFGLGKAFGQKRTPSRTVQIPS